MQAHIEPKLPVRAGVYSSIEDVDATVLKLLAAGLSHSEIIIVCSDEAKKSHFQDVIMLDPAGKNLPLAATTGGIMGATIAGVTMQPSRLQLEFSLWLSLAAQEC